VSIVTKIKAVVTTACVMVTKMEAVVAIALCVVTIAFSVLELTNINFGSKKLILGKP